MISQANYLLFKRRLVLPYHRGIFGVGSSTEEGVRLGIRIVTIASKSREKAQSILLHRKRHIHRLFGAKISVLAKPPCGSEHIRFVGAKID
jgi:hypothetical protein